MKNIVKYIAISALMVPMIACDDLFEPAIENIKDPSSMATEANYADQILGSAYILMPYSSASESDVATDDAVSNDNTNAYRLMATGSWTSQTGQSLNNWRDRNASIQYCNLFLEHVDEVTFSNNETINAMFRDRLKGEAYGLRALNMYFLLQNYAGKSASGEFLGVPIWTSSYDATTDMNVPRASFQECVNRFMEDADTAIGLLPTDYKDLSGNSELPAKYAALGIDYMDYNRVFGSGFWTRVSGRIIEAVRAQMALLAASPAFEGASNIDWAKAADYAAAVIDRNNGLAGLSPKGHLWFTASEVGNSAKATSNDAEIIWRGNYEENSTLEADNYPPSLYGNGRVNPTQNLVDAFPMANGYPITHPSSLYDPAHPYAGRDPRLDAYIVYSGGSPLGVNSSTIYTGTDAGNNDGIDKENGHSTRTGYYMRKLLRNDVNPNSTNEVKKYHYTKRIRFTEIYLAYAEAANEAWGPTGAGTHAYSAYDVIKAIRKRAGVGVGTEGDPYLEAAKAGKDEMRKLIRNERRLELCFENIRFWDLRRWKADLNEGAKGVQVSGNGTAFNYIDVEQRRYQDYMIYGPLPYTDVIKFGALVQNQGW